MDAPKRKRVSLVAAYDGHGRLLLGLRRDVGRWTLPGGHLEEGERPADAAARELREEAGLTAGPLTKVQVQPNPPELPEIHVFSTTVAGKPHGHLDPDGECDEWAWHPVADGLDPKVWDRLYGPPGDLNVVRQLHHRGEELSKGEGLGKIATERDVSAATQGMGLRPQHLRHLETTVVPPQDIPALDEPSLGMLREHRLASWGGPKEALTPGWLRQHPQEKWAHHLHQAYGMHDAERAFEGATRGTSTPAVMVDGRLQDGFHRAYVHYALGTPLPVAHYEEDTPRARGLREMGLSPHLARSEPSADLADRRPFVKHGVLVKDEAEGAPAVQEAHHHEGPPPALRDHILFHPKGSVGMISGEAPRAPSAPGGHEGLVQDLRQLGLHHEETHGSYGGPERSVIVHHPTLAQMYHLGQKYGQESIVHGEGGRHRLVYTAGPHAGMYHPALARTRHSAEAPEDFYTALPGNGHVSLYFNFDKLLRLDPKELDLTQKAEGRGLPGRVVPGHAGDEHLVVRAVKHGLLVSGRELGRKRHQELLRSWPPLAFEGLAKVQSTPTFPKLGMPDDRRETPIVDTPHELRSKVYALSAAAARTMSPEAAAAERAHGRAAGALSSSGEVSTVPGFRTGYAAGGGLREAAGLTRQFPQLHGHPMAPVATQAHENWHMMMNRVRERFGSQPAQDVAEHLFSSIPEDARRHLERFARRRSSMRPPHPYYHEETLALLHNWLNNPGERSTYFQHFPATPDEQHILDTGIKRAYRHVRREAARLTPEDVYRINDDAERRRGGLRRTEPLGKAISQLPAGQPIEVPHTFSPGIHDAPPAANERFFHRAYDYSHLLPEGQAHMRLVVHHTGIEGGGKHPRAERIRAWMYDATRPNDRVGQVIAHVVPGQKAGKVLRAQPRAVEPHSELDETYRGRGLGTAMYEAAYAHARHVAGITHVRGGMHSNDADAVHRRLAAKHGFSYKPAPNDVSVGYPHGAYAYTLKAEAVPGDDEAALLGSPAPLEFGRDDDDHRGFCSEPRLEDLAADRGAAALLDHHDPGERWLGARAGDLSAGDHLRALLDEDPDVRAAAHERPMSDYTLRLLAAARVGRDGRHPGAQARDGLGHPAAHAGHGQLAEAAAAAGGRDGAREALEQVGPLRAAMEGLGKADATRPTTVYRVQGPEGQGPHSSLAAGDLHEAPWQVNDAASRNEQEQVFPMDDFEPDDLEAIQRHQAPFAFERPEHAVNWFGQDALDDMAHHGFRLKPIQAKKVWRSRSGKQIAFLPHKMRKAEPLEKDLIHDDAQNPMTVYRVQRADGQGPHVGAHAPEVDEAVAQNQPLQPGPHSDFTHQDLVQTGFSLNPPEIGDDVSDDEAQRNYTTWQKQLGNARLHRFAFERPEHAVQWFGQPALDTLKQHGYELRPVQARKVWRSQSGKQVIYLPHEMEKALIDPPTDLLGKSVRTKPGVRAASPEPGVESWDYSHVLHPKQHAGYRLRVEVAPAQPVGPHPEDVPFTPVSAHVTDPDGYDAGYVHADVREHKGRRVIVPYDAEVADRGKGLGQAMYEAMYAHVIHHHGVTHAMGGEHSDSAYRMHARLAEKHRLNHHARLNPDGETGYGPDNNGAWESWRYRIAPKAKS